MTDPGSASRVAVVELGVPGPNRQAGFLLRVPEAETLLWDLEHEVLSTRRHWIPEMGGWWIAGSYLAVVLDIVLRSVPELVVRRAGDPSRVAA